MHCRMTLSKCRSKYAGIDSIVQPQCGSGRRKVSDRAIDKEPFGQDDLADHQDLVHRNESALGPLAIKGKPHQRPPITHNASRERDRATAAPICSAYEGA